MAKFLTALLTATITLALAGCSQTTSWFAYAPLSDPNFKVLSISWNKIKTLKASTIISGLEKLGICLPAAKDFQSPDPSTDFGKAWAKDQMRTCDDFTDVKQKPGNCQSTFFVSVGKANLFNPKRPLIYEDSMSVALLYGENWQLEMSPARGAADPIETTVASCKGAVNALVKIVGGNVNRYGDYK